MREQESRGRGAKKNTQGCKLDKQETKQARNKAVYLL